MVSGEAFLAANIINTAVLSNLEASVEALNTTTAKDMRIRRSYTYPSTLIPFSSFATTI